MAKRRSTRRRGGGWFDWLTGSTPAATPEPVPVGQSSPVAPAAPPAPATTMGGKKRKTRRGGRHRRGHSKSAKIYGH